MARWINQARKELHLSGPAFAHKGPAAAQDGRKDQGEELWLGGLCASFQIPQRFHDDGMPQHVLTLAALWKREKYCKAVAFLTHNRIA